MSDDAYYVYEEPIPPKVSPKTEKTIASSDEPELNTQLVYRPVTVEQNDDGELYAYYYDTDAKPERVLKDGGKTYVPTQQVHPTPPDDAVPDYKFKQRLKDEGRIPPWV